MKSVFFRLLTTSVLLACSNTSWAHREIHEGDTAYYCDKDVGGRHGGQSWSDVPCEEFGAKEIRRGVFSNGPRPVPPPPPEKITDPATETNVVDDGKPHPVPVKEIEAANARRDELMKHGGKSLFRLLGFAFGIAILARLTGRSSVFGFLLGAIAYAGLVSANVLSF